MSISEKLALIAENEQKVYDSGYAKGKSEGGSSTNKLPQVIDRSVTEITAEDLAGATEVGNYAFAYSPNLTKVTIPDGVTKIKEYAFMDCSQLSNVVFPNSVTSMGNGAFIRTNLAEVTFPNNLPVIQANLFTGCTNLKKITIPVSVKDIRSAFSSVSLEETYYEGDLWEWCQISRTNSGSSIMTQGNLYIKGELLEDAVIEPTESTPYYMKLNLYSFDYCSSIKTLKIKSLGQIYTTNYDEPICFSCENLTTVEICSAHMCGSSSSDTKKMSKNMFKDCSNLKDIYVVWSEGEIANAPWGATDATIHYDTPYTLTIGGEEYTAIAKLTWAEWCNSEYNTGGFYVGDYGQIYQSPGKHLYHYDGATYGPQGTHKMNRHDTYKVYGN